MWMGDMEQNFLDKVKDTISWEEVDILFAPHHSRDSGTVSSDVLEKLKPQIIVVGEAPSQHLNYYPGYNTITQNTAKDIIFKCETGKVHVYVSNDNYLADFLNYEGQININLGHYIGSFDTKEK